MSHHSTYREILREVRETHREVERIEHMLEQERKRITHFTPIQEITMVTLSAGNTATFSTTPLPANAVPTPSGIQWSSSDTTNAPVVVNPNDPSGLSANVTFPAGVAAGVSFTLTISYTNSDGTTATQSGSFTTVAPPPTDVTGFTPIVQSA